MLFSPKISVIVPIYNSAKYLEQCLNSLVLQTYSNIEIICIDDGSTDNSLEILQKYSEKDERIKIFSQVNSGVSVARNLGLSNATGDYVSFIDSDDWVLLTLYNVFIKYLNKIQQNVDIFMFNISTYRAGVNDAYQNLFFDASDWTKHTSEYSIHTFNDCMRPFSRNLSAANKIYRRQFLFDNDIKFEENLIYEDQYFSIKTFLNAKSIMFTEDVLYKYRKYNDTTLSSLESERVFDIFEILDLIDAEINKLDVYESYKYALFQYKMNTFVQRYQLCPKEMKNEYFEEMKNRLLVASTQGIDTNIASKLRNYALFVAINRLNRADFDKYLIEISKD